MKPNRADERDFMGGWFDRLTTNGIMGWFITNEIEGWLTMNGIGDRFTEREKQLMGSAPSIAIIDYKASNLRSVQKALEECGAFARITADAADIADADGVVFPGQGACDPSMRGIRERGLFNIIKSSIGSGKPFLGVCLGLQLLLESSEEGKEPCLAVLKGSTKRLPPEKTEHVGLKIPHMGWNQVSLSLEHPVFEGVPDGSFFYFVHSYYADPDDKRVVAGITNYGIDFCSAVAWDNVAAVQFHPEKSGALGLRLYRNFLSLVDANRKALAWK